MNTVEKTYSVTVIMSTYNGEEYIVEQLNSLMRQINISIYLLVRDDGSSDNTVNIIKKYQSVFAGMIIFEENNIGATKSFHRAAKLAYENFQTDYYSFCDQDDIWEDEKLIKAIKELEKTDSYRPAMYFSNLMMVNNSKEKLGMLLDDSIVSKSRKNPMAAIYTYGCTCVFNSIALNKFICLKDRYQYIYHDNWLYSICVFLGTVIYDNKSYILYRQTGKNVSGEKKTGIMEWLNRMIKLKYLSGDKRIYESIAINLLAEFINDLYNEDIILLKEISNYRFKLSDKFKLIFNKRMYTKKLSKNICILGRICINRL